MITYRIDALDIHAHVYRIKLTIAKPHSVQRVSLPAWIPGSYMLREFSRHLFDLQAKQGTRKLPVTPVDKAAWDISCPGRGALTLSYSVYAFDTSVRAAFLSAQRGFFNGTSIFLEAQGHSEQAHRVQLKDLPAAWEVATALSPLDIDDKGRGTYQAADYDELIDHPVELGTFWRGRFTAHGVAHDLIVTGALPDFDAPRLLQDTQTLCEAQIAFWHINKKPPFDRYVFLLNAMDDGFGGLEHRNSTALIAGRRDLPQSGREDLSEGYLTLLGLISHEYFHTWNVKRMKPAEFGRYQLDRENYTQLLWFFEGFTAYYDDLFLVRSGLIDEARYFKLLSKTFSGVLNTPGRHVQSVAQSSFDAWVKYYRPDENSQNIGISYYTKGSLVALALDLSLRARGVGSLDDVMRALWLRSGGGAVSENDIFNAVDDIAERPLSKDLYQWVHGTHDPPWAELFDPFGIVWQASTPTMAQRWGLKVSESALTGIKISHVLSGGLGEKMGLSAGDELLAINQWRLRKLDEAARFMPPDKPGILLVCRDQRLLPLNLPPGAASVSSPGVGDWAPQGHLVHKAGAPAMRTASGLRKEWLGL